MVADWTANLRPFDAGAILRVLERHGVVYVLVGGIAAVAHGYLIALDAKLYADPRRSDVRAGGTPPEAIDLDLRDPASLRRQLAWYFSTAAGRLDVLLVVDGPGGFEPLAGDAVAVRMAGVEVLVASLPDIIEAKETANRPKDRAVLDELRRLLLEQRRLG